MYLLYILLAGFVKRLDYISILFLISSRLIKGLLDGETSFVQEMIFFVDHFLQNLETSFQVPLTILSQKEYIFRNIRDIANFHEW